VASGAEHKPFEIDNLVVPVAKEKDGFILVFVDIPFEQVIIGDG
jgi:hypothetical protein